MEAKDSYVQDAKQDIHEYVSQRGLYNGYDKSFADCLRVHEIRWQDRYMYLQKLTRSTMTRLQQKGMTLTEVVLLVSVLKLRYIGGTIDQAIHTKLLAIEPYHESKEIGWVDIYQHMLVYSEDATQPGSAELKQLFTKVLNALIEVISANPMVFEAHKEKLSNCNWDDLTDDEKRLISLGLQQPTVFAEYKDIFQLYVDIESGDFSILRSYMLQVQLHVRILLGEQVQCTLSRVVEENVEDANYAILEYPKSLHVHDPPTLELHRCDVRFHDIDTLYSVVLPSVLMKFLPCQ